MEEVSVDHQIATAPLSILPLHTLMPDSGSNYNHFSNMTTFLYYSGRTKRLKKTVMIGCLEYRNY